MEINNHLKFSLIKSSLRILAGAVLIAGFYVVAGLLFIVAELLGIAEEIL